MPAEARLDLKLNQAEKDIVVRAAAIVGTTVAGFVRAAAKEKASLVIEREHRVMMTSEEFERFVDAINRPFEPNAALQKALASAMKVRRA
jgi:uncharacterized protein (DUF1778 family)